MTDRMVKGFNLEKTAGFIDSHYSHDDRQRIHAQLSPELRGRLERVSAGAWYPLRDQVELLHAMASVAADASEAERNAVELGRHLSRAATGTFMRLLLKVLTPPVFLKKVPDIWPRMFSFGRFESDASTFPSGRTVMIIRDVDGFDYVAPVSVGWIESVFEAMGYPSASVKAGPVEGEPRGSAIRFEIEWS